jgi:nucleotide-binding universal stress UspA family protein
VSSENPKGPMILCRDGSDGAEQAIRHAARIAGSRHRAIVVFAFVPTESARGVLGGLSGPDAPIMSRPEAEDLLRRGKDVASAAGFEPEPLLITAEEKTSRVIVNLAEEHDAPLIVMGQRKRSPVGTLILGSVAREVLGVQHRPVLLVGPGSSGPYPRSE